MMRLWLCLALVVGACTASSTTIVEPHEDPLDDPPVYHYPPPVIGGCKGDVCVDTLMRLP